MCVLKKEVKTKQLLLITVDDTVSASDKKLCASVAFFDLCKAFDSFDHQLLLQRLNECGISGTEICWFMSYLTDHFQRVKCNNSYSSYGLVTGTVVFLREVPSVPCYFWSASMVCLLMVSYFNMLMILP